MCVDEIDAGRKPYCVASCIMRVLDVGPMNQLRAGIFKTKAMGPSDKLVNDIKGFANPKLTNPSIVFVPHNKGRMKPT